MLIIVNTDLQRNENFGTQIAVSNQQHLTRLDLFLWLRNSVDNIRRYGEKNGNMSCFDEVTDPDHLAISGLKLLLKSTIPKPYREPALIL